MNENLKIDNAQEELTKKQIMHEQELSDYYEEKLEERRKTDEQL